VKEIDSDNPNDALFYLKSNRFNDYLCAEETSMGILGNKKRVKRAGVSTAWHNPKCQWRLLENKRELKIDKPTYEIWNQAFNQSLLADWHVFGIRLVSRNVYLSTRQQHDQAKSSDRFKWIVDCRNGEFMWA
jgi:hypothetical protein